MKRIKLVSISVIIILFVLTLIAFLLLCKTDIIDTASTEEALMTEETAEFYEADIEELGIKAEKNNDGLTAASRIEVDPESVSVNSTAESYIDKPDDIDLKIENIIKEESLETKVSQLFIVTPEALTGKSSVSGKDEASKSKFKEFPVSGIIYMGQNLTGPDQTREMLEFFSECSKDTLGLPVFQAIDEEGGKVSRIANNSAFNKDNVGDMVEIGKTGDSENAYEAGKYIGSYLSEYGFNLDFAPVADVITVSGNKLMEKRSFGTDKDLVSQMDLEFSRGLKVENVLSCAKHFPGHGNTVEDSHKGYAVSDKTIQELEETELVPFKAETGSGISMIMAGHISLPKITGDMTPSSLSPQIIQGILRNEMGYDGIVITDAMNMGAIVNNYSESEATVLAIEAGCDIILSPVNMEKARQAIIDAVESGEINERRIDESLRRIYRVKLQMQN